MSTKEILFTMGPNSVINACKAFDHLTDDPPLSLGQLVAANCDLAASHDTVFTLPEILRGLAVFIERGSVTATPSEALAKHIDSRLGRPSFDAVDEMGFEREMEHCEEHPCCPRCGVVKRSEVGWIHCFCPDTETGLDDGEWLDRVEGMDHDQA
jgi:hypothetical protein